MKSVFFPITVVDGFFDNPETVRKTALEMDYFQNSSGHWPGVRTNPIENELPLFYKEVVNKIFGLFNNSNTQLNYKGTSQFQIITESSEQGWVHKDNPYMLTCIVYLSPGSESGTSLYTKKNPITFSDTTFLQEKQHSNINNKDDKKSREAHNEEYKETVSVKGCYNRMVLFDSHLYHSAHNYFGTGKEDSRLTLITFLNLFMTDSYPIQRMNVIQEGTYV